MYLVLARPRRGWAMGIPWPCMGWGAAQYHFELLATQFAFESALFEFDFEFGLRSRVEDVDNSPGRVGGSDTHHGKDGRPVEPQKKSNLLTPSSSSRSW